MCGGGWGLGKIVDVAEMIVRSFPDSTVKIICGDNRNALYRLSKLANKKVSVYGLMPSLVPYIASTRVIVTKAGAVTVLEAISQNKPVAISASLPGHEEENVDFLVRTGSGKDCRSGSELVRFINEILFRPVSLDQNVFLSFTHGPTLTQLIKGAKQVGLDNQ